MEIVQGHDDVAVSVAATLAANHGIGATQRELWFTEHQKAIELALSKALTAAASAMLPDPLLAVSKALADLAEQKKKGSISNSCVNGRGGVAHCLPCVRL
mmetsp:Transcript_7107/g.14524  ORF Transcript_7107/g.14524 Transcript_7107/m.14524 type:complete len:100 (-) Transcript_7107:740-1039(-)